MKKMLILIPLVGCFLLMGCESLEKDIVGVWENDACATEFDDEFRLNEDGTVEGMPGYDTYEIEKEDNADYDYLLFQSDFEDTKRFKVKMKDEDTLELDDTDSAYGCTTQRVDN